MAAESLADRWGGLPLLPALPDQLADQGAAVLTGVSLEVLEALLRLRVQPHREGHGMQRPRPV